VETNNQCFMGINTLGLTWWRWLETLKCATPQGANLTSTRKIGSLVF